MLCYPQPLNEAKKNSEAKLTNDVLSPLADNICFFQNFQQGRARPHRSLSVKVAGIEEADTRNGDVAS